VTNGEAECLQSLNFKEALTRRDQVVQADAGTNEWIWTNLAYLEWSHALSGVLWIQGKPGSGKSVLTKSIVSRISASRSVLVASWFYSRRGGDMGTSESSMMRSIVYQLLEKNQALFRIYKHSYRQYRSDFSTAFTTFLNRWSMETNVPALLFVIDAMDESSSHDTVRGLEILKVFSNFVEQPNSKLKVLISSRPYRTIEKAFGSWDILLENENSRDIEIMVDAGLAVLKKAITEAENGDDELTAFAHVRKMLRRSKISEDVRVQHRLSTSATSSTALRPRSIEPKEMDFMREYLLKNACGVMLWVALTLGEMVRQAKKGIYTWQNLMNLLRKLPVELRSVYQHIATELNASQTPEDQSTRDKILGWIMTANSKGPFRLRELLDALSIPNALDEETFLNSSEDPLVINRPMVMSWNSFYQSLREFCGPFIEVISPGAKPSERFDTLEDVGPDFAVQLLHQTVKEFLDNSATETVSIKANVAALMVEESATAYLHLAIPTRPTKYTPIIREFGSSWEASIEEAVGYLEGKWLLKFVLDNYITEQSEMLSAVRHSDGPTWILSTFFNNVTYKDVYELETARRSVVGRCFWFACSHGLNVAVDNMLCAASLCPGWWYCHRQIVLSGLQLAAVEHNLKHLAALLEHHRDRFSRTPPVANAVLTIKVANRQTRGLRARGRPSSHAPVDIVIINSNSEVYSGIEISKPRKYTKSIPISSIGDSTAAEICIQRVLDYLDTGPSREPPRRNDDIENSVSDLEEPY
jgi:NACHT domain